MAYIEEDGEISKENIRGPINYTTKSIQNVLKFFDAKSQEHNQIVMQPKTFIQSDVNHYK